jgi:methionyl-tRNA formyltransferase
VRLVYLGTPLLALPPLRALVAAGHEVSLVVSAADKKRGRGAALSPSPVKAGALELGLAVTDRIDDLLELRPRPELGVVVAYGRLIKPHILAAVPMVNLHFSPLPRWRGAAPVERAILAGDTSTAVCLMEVAEGLDTGGIYRQIEVPIDDDVTLDALRDQLVDLGTGLVLDALAEGLGEPRPQTGEPLYAVKIDPSELQLDWERPSIDIHRVVRLGGAWTTHDGRRLKVWRTSLDGGGLPVPTGDGTIDLVEVQPEGKPKMAAVAWANGARWQPGDRLGT